MTRFILLDLLPPVVTMALVYLLCPNDNRALVLATVVFVGAQAIGYARGILRT